MTDVEDCYLMMFHMHGHAEQIDLPPVTFEVARFVCSQPETGCAKWFVGWTRTPGDVKKIADRGGAIAAVVRRAKLEVNDGDTDQG